jgi:hypothetical protein
MKASGKSSDDYDYDEDDDDDNNLQVICGDKTTAALLINIRGCIKNIPD